MSESKKGGEGKEVVKKGGEGQRRRGKCSIL